jgi:thiol:disulfide interchange protein DsbD
MTPGSRLRKWLAPACCALVLAAGCEQTDGGGKLKGFPKPDGGHPVKAELLTEHEAIQQGGTTRVGVQFTMPHGWHIYAKEPGDAGLATQIDWTGSSPSLTFGELVWPKPKQFQDPGDITTYGYEESVLLFSPVSHAGQGKPESRVKVRAHAKWLACKEICLPGEAKLAVELPVTSDAPKPAPHGDLFTSN